MKLKVVFLFIGLVLGYFSYGQIKIGDQPQNIDPASVLELQSTSRALVLTRVNNTQMNAITPLQGALVYNTETKCVHYYDGGQWLNICDALTNSVNISMVDNGDGSYTFTDAVGVETIITTTTNSTFEVANDSLVLTDSNNNALSVALDSLNRHTYSTDAIVNIFERSTGTVINDSTIVIRRTGNNFNFEVGEITGDNIKDGSLTRVDYGSSSINGNAHIQNRTIPPLKLIGGLNGQILQTQLIGSPNPSETAVWVPKNGLFNAAEISYNPVDSGLEATNVKSALDELSTSSNSLTIGDILTQGNDAGAQLIRNVLDPSDAQDVATRNYVDNAISGSNILEDANIFVGDAAGTAQAVPVSGDATMDNTGILTIAPNAITFNEILDRTIGEPDISFNAVTNDIIRVNAVTTDKILNETILSEDIADDAIDNSKIADKAVQIENILNGTANQVLKTNAAGTLVEWGTLNSNNITGQDLIADDTSITVTGGTGTTLANTSLAVTNLGITNDKIADDAVTTTKIINQTILDEDVSPTAAIAGIKIDPEFGPQNITTTGTLNTGDATVGTLSAGNSTITGSLSTTGTATVGANTITNVDGTNGQVLTTDGAGSATWTSLPADNDITYTPGEAITLTGTEFSIADGDITSAKITNETILDEDVSPTAAIAGIKIDPEFGPQNITTTGTLASGNTTITGTLAVSNEFLDANGDAGTVGQILSSTATGTDWINPPTIVAMGKVDPSATSERTNSFVTSVVRTSPGNYTVTMSSDLNLNYVIQLSLFQVGPGFSIEVVIQNLNSFDVQIYDSSSLTDATWYFTVTDF
jgi:hypothetical protein